eukprot:scaffold78992_cov22-Tisochrysis_lutea.AAC.1
MFHSIEKFCSIGAIPKLRRKQILQIISHRMLCRFTAGSTRAIFRWSCEKRVNFEGSEEECLILGGDGWRDNVLLSVENDDLVKAGIVPQDKLTIRLEARFADNQNITTGTQLQFVCWRFNPDDTEGRMLPHSFKQDVLVEGADILAAFTHGTPQGAVSSANQEATFDASASFDPSDPTNIIPMRCVKTGAGTMKAQMHCHCQDDGAPCSISQESILLLLMRKEYKS